MRFILGIVFLLTFAGAVAAQDPPPPAAEYSSKIWKEFTSKEGRFSVSFPGTPKQQDRTLETPLGPVKTHDFVVQSDVSTYYLTYSEFPNIGPLTAGDQKEMLDSSRDRAIRDGAKLISEADVSVGGTPAREFLAEKNGMIVRARVVYSNGRLYNLIIGVAANTAFREAKPSANIADRTELFEAISAKFFDSFKFTK